jgi:hypothetical protein
MKTIELSAVEKEMANFNFGALTAQSTAAKANIAKADSIGDITAEICKVWSSVRKYVIIAEGFPFVGKFVTILADVLDSICPAAA